MQPPDEPNAPSRTPRTSLILHVPLSHPLDQPHPFVNSSRELRVWLRYRQEGSVLTESAAYDAYPLSTFEIDSVLKDLGDVNVDEICASSLKETEGAGNFEAPSSSHQLPQFHSSSTPMIEYPTMKLSPLINKQGPFVYNRCHSGSSFDHYMQYPSFDPYLDPSLLARSLFSDDAIAEQVTPFM